MKYIVMETKRSYAVLLDENGRFVTAANLSYTPGQEIENPVLMIHSSDHRRRNRRRLAGTAAALLSLLLIIILIVGLLWYGRFTEPAASIYLSINPQVKIEINDDDRVIQMEPLNADGEILIRNYRSWGKEMDDVIEDLLSRCIEMGYLSYHQTVILKVDAVKDSQRTEYIEDLSEITEEYLEDSPYLSAEIHPYSEDNITSSQNTDPTTGDDDRENAR